MERQSALLLESCERVIDDPGIASVCRAHRDETRDHLEMIERLLAARSASPSLTADVREAATMNGLRLLAERHRGATSRIVAAVYAYEHFEIATYGLLRRMGEQAFDGELVAACERTLSEEREAAKSLESHLELVAVDVRSS